MKINFGTETDCEKCKPKLNCWCKDDAYDDKDIDDNFVEDFLKESNGTDFKVPEGYFEGFQKNVHSKIYRDYTPWWKLSGFKVGVSVLTSLVLVFLVVNEFPENIDQAKVELNNEELLAYFSENIELD